MSGLEFCRWTNENRPDVPVIVVTGFGSMETVIAAIRAGAYDFITKPIQMDDLALTLSRAVQLRNLRQEVKRLRSEVATTKTFEEIVGTSPAVRSVYDLVDKMRAIDVPTLILTGDEDWSCLQPGILMKREIPSAARAALPRRIGSTP